MKNEDEVDVDVDGILRGIGWLGGDFVRAVRCEESIAFRRIFRHCILLTGISLRPARSGPEGSGCIL